MGMSVNTFYDLTPRQFDNIRKGFLKKLEDHEKREWERTRNISYTIYMSIPEGKGKKKKPLKEFMKFPWEETKQGRTKKTPEQIKEMFKKWDKAQFNNDKQWPV